MVMRKHQRYFPLYKPATQDLLPHFITVANGPIDIPTVKVGCLLSCLSQLSTSLPCPHWHWLPFAAVPLTGAHSPSPVSEWYQLLFTLPVTAAPFIFCVPSLVELNLQMMHAICLVSHVGMHAARHLRPAHKKWDCNTGCRQQKCCHCYLGCWHLNF